MQADREIWLNCAVLAGAALLLGACGMISPEKDFVVDCYGWRMAVSDVENNQGDGFCHYGLYCEEYNFDDGDCEGELIGDSID